MSGRRALVVGAGIAGLTCAKLLRQHGWQVDCIATPLRTGPIVVVGGFNAHLLLQLWRADGALFAGFHRLHGRVVQWAQDGEPAQMAAPAFAMPIDVLQERLARRAEASGVGFIAVERAGPAGYDWVVQAGGRGTVPDEAIAFGCRRGVSVPVKLTPRARMDRSIIESVRGGWLFMVPLGLGRGVLQAVCAERIIEPQASLDRLLGESHLIAALIEEIGEDPMDFAAMPSLSRQRHTAYRIAVGDAAAALDPLSGNGIGNGLHSAILAVAVLNTAGTDATPQACLEHYARRLGDSICEHVQSCIDHYRRAAHAASWHSEIRAMSEVLRRLLPRPGVHSFMLNHGRLCRLHGATDSGRMDDAGGF